MKMGRSLRGWSSAFAVVAFVALGLLGKPGRLIARNRLLAGSAPGREADSGCRAGKEEQPAQETTQVPTAGDAYMNIQVLKDIPADQLIPAMKYTSQVLGVHCDFCHDAKSFESDDKPEKGTARNMMRMMFAINKDNFNGQREVTCYTCHRGASKAASIPTLGAAGPGGAMPAARETPPVPLSGAAAPRLTVDEILAKYAEALGGAAAVQKIATLDEKGTIELPSNGSKAQVEELRKAPDKAAVVVRLPGGAEFAWGYNGTAGWQQEPGHAADDLKGDDLVRAKRAAAFIPGLNLKQAFSRAQVAAIDKIGDREAYRVVAFRSGGGQVRFYFDTQSGLLLRVSERIESPLGALPQDTDYSDYREVDGVKLPFTVTQARVEGPTTFEWEQIQANTTIDDARFDKPGTKAAQP
jgi:photosynthetic reaction center cytochrome c subunit